MGNLVFDLARDGSWLQRSGFVLAWAVGGWIGTITFLVIDRRKGRRWILFALIALLASVLAIHECVTIVSAQRTCESGGCRVVEGVVTGYETTRVHRQTFESFSVDGVTFRYSDTESRVGFNTTRLKGGPMQDGVRVHIRYLPGYGPGGANEIVRLEIYPKDH